MKPQSRIPELKDAMQQFAEKWTGIGLSTDPANRPEAETAIYEVYRLAGYSPPQIIWADSPVAMFEAAIHRKREVGKGLSLEFMRYLSSSGQIHNASVSVDVLMRLIYCLHENSLENIYRIIHGQCNAAMHAKYTLTTQFRPIFEPVLAGQHGIRRCAFNLALAEVLELEKRHLLRAMLMLMQQVGAWFPFQHICYVSERHSVIELDWLNRLHNTDGAAVVYPDGWEVYALHGVSMPENSIMHPHTLTVDQIVDTENVEVRRILIERYGIEHFLVDTQATLLHQDTTGTLYSIAVRRWRAEPIIVVKVLDPSTGREYLLRVPPHMRRAREAVAWTFGLTEAEFAPILET